MDYKVFFSHSMGQEDLEMVYEAVRDARLRGIACYVAERDQQLGVYLPDKIAAAILDSDCVVAFLTVGGSHSAWVQQEIAFAVAHGKQVIPVVEKGQATTGFLTGVEYLPLDRAAPQPALQQLTSYLSGRKSERDDRRVAEADRRVVAAEQRAAVAGQRAQIATGVAIGATVALLVVILLLLSVVAAAESE
jgi:hypothetical protein